MKTLLTTLYQNDITSLITPKTNDKETQNLLDLICRQEDKLKQNLPPELLSIFEKYDDCTSELHSLNGEKNFVCGVRFGIRLIFEAMSAD